MLANINKLNRSLEGVIAVSLFLFYFISFFASQRSGVELMCGMEQVGNEFSSVEALWSQFEGVMAKDPNAEAETQVGEEGEDGEGEDESELPERRGVGR